MIEPCDRPSPRLHSPESISQSPRSGLTSLVPLTRLHSSVLARYREVDVGSEVLDCTVTKHPRYIKSH